MQLQGYGSYPQQSYPIFPTGPGYVPTQNRFYGGPPQGGFYPGSGLAQLMGALQNMLATMNNLSQGWGGFAGQQQQQQPRPAYNPVQQIQGGAPLVDYASMHFPQSANYGGPTTGYGNTGSNQNGATSMPRPSDPREFSSYLQAQLAGGTLEGRTTVAQRDAIPGTRFGGVQDSTQWNASLARNYAYQFAAYASGNDPLSANGLAKGAQAFEQMKPEAQLFMQVASVFKGNMLNGPGFYDNPGLKTLLQSKGLNDLANKPQVGKTDVQSIGAIASAINSGDLSLNEVINSGTISDLDRYNQVISYVSNGGFASDLNAYDTVPF